ncbi:MAG: carboxylating nicotinate-nucleotide diphosphorylase [Bacteroidales bacterium]|jgi:nicotinate-nucleotide pyrophosphorylase (carboxylating)|nr:carboxylating nicotinate-nucleotide diphosphorylase [Bacteroidales bacterium]MBP5420335.1 carboxylating nicotinate-nucleotide diphosphorylase [Bacteroidales bacterium]MCR5696612.1 carboxylating nicotinate-nucleotide diphosphorylase [Marinilabiliaceae bacterium]
MTDFDKYLIEFIDNAIKEDVGDGDHSSLSCIPEDAIDHAKLIVKDNGIIAGVDVAEKIFHRLDPSVKFEKLISDGQRVKKGDIAFRVELKTRSLLLAERLVLNVMQHMSGIATQTGVYVEKLKGLHTRVLDTRKTTPGMRLLDKLAVKIGGGCNHRIGLFDMIMLKDNHIDFAGGIRQAIDRTHDYLKRTGRNLDIEVEVRNLDELQQAMEVGGIRRIMLDNFDIPTTRKAVEMIGGKFETESSGGITLETLRDYAECGVDFISVGALTHHVSALDMSLKAY